MDKLLVLCTIFAFKKTNHKIGLLFSKNVGVLRFSVLQYQYSLFSILPSNNQISVNRVLVKPNYFSVATSSSIRLFPIRFLLWLLSCKYIFLKNNGIFEVLPYKFSDILYFTDEAICLYCLWADTLQMVYFFAKAKLFCLTLLRLYFSSFYVVFSLA